MTSTRVRAENWLRYILSCGPLMKRDVMDMAVSAGLAERTVHRARKRIGAVYYIYGYGPDKHSMWSLE